MKDTAQHTKGPWAIDESYLPRLITGQQKKIAVLVEANPEHKANARLIAAAPALLEALETMVSDSGLGMGAKYEKALDKARAAIDLAKKGE